MVLISSGSPILVTKLLIALLAARKRSEADPSIIALFLRPYADKSPGCAPTLVPSAPAATRVGSPAPCEPGSTFRGVYDVMRVSSCCFFNDSAAALASDAGRVWMEGAGAPSPWHHTARYSSQKPAPVGLSDSEKFRYSEFVEIMFWRMITPQSVHTMCPCAVSITTLVLPQASHSGCSI